MSDWQVIMIEGHDRAVRAFVTGFLADRRLASTAVVFGDDVGLERESVHERLRALLKGGHHAVLVPDDVASALADALARGGGAVGMRIADRHPLTGASFRFSVEVYSREVATQIRLALRALPPGVRFEQQSEHEEEHADAKGVELYAPEHHYAYRASGTLVGPVAGVLDVRRGLGEIEAVTLAPLHLS